MEQGLKERLVGAAVLVILAVIFIPMLLDDTDETDLVITETNIPPKPEKMPETDDEGEFSSRIIPLENEKQEQQTTGQDTDHAKKIITAEPVEEEVQQEPAGDDDTVKGTDGRSETTVGLNAWVVQLGSFESEENAQSLNEKLRDAGYTSFVEPLKQESGTVHRVRVGPELKRSDAQKIRDKLEKSLQLEGIVVSYP
ncbi:MAG TPA: SPOR domain-containing protein [Gammaproteobacteria bacterium]|nr:SPOR domain-containing protein [Gammaproteobacteria bacterium]